MSGIRAAHMSEKNTVKHFSRIRAACIREKMLSDDSRAYRLLASARRYC
jgi:hypothetical protein